MTASMNSGTERSLRVRRNEYLGRQRDAVLVLSHGADHDGPGVDLDATDEFGRVLKENFTTKVEKREKGGTDIFAQIILLRPFLAARLSLDLFRDPFWIFQKLKNLRIVVLDDLGLRPLSRI